MCEYERNDRYKQRWGELNSPSPQAQLCSSRYRAASDITGLVGLGHGKALQGRRLVNMRPDWLSTLPFDADA
jgi:hypothetical protein